MMNNSMRVRQVVEEFVERFGDIMEVRCDEKKSEIIWFFENNDNGDQFIIIYDRSDSLHHRDGVHIDLPIDVDSLNYTINWALRQGCSTIFIHN